MTYPSPEQIGVALEALHTELARWQVEGDRLSGLAGEVPRLAIASFPAGAPIYGDFIKTYNEAVGIFAGRCHDGARASYEISLRLSRVAEVYAQEEDANLHAVNHLY